MITTNILSPPMHDSRVRVGIDVTEIAQVEASNRSIRAPIRAALVHRNRTSRRDRDPRGAGRIPRRPLRG